MVRPHFVTVSDLARWSDIIDQDENLPPEIAASPVIREVCYAGLWMAEKLQELKCPDDLTVRIQWNAGRASFGRDPWEVHQFYLSEYIDGKLTFEEDAAIDVN